MKVPLLDLKPQYQSLISDISAAIAQVCDGQQFILGPAVSELESAVSRYCQCEIGVGVSSGTDALLLALMALEIGPGDEVLTSAYTFFATAGAMARVGVRPVFLDIEPSTCNLSPVAVSAYLERHCQRQGDALIDRLTGCTVRGIVPVHLYGQLADMAGFVAIAREYDLKLIEDAAQAIGAEDAGGQRAGSFGDVGCLSFFPTKNLGAFGDAGMCVTSDPEFAHLMKVLRVHGSEPKYHHARIGGNFRIDELQAAVLNVKLRSLDTWTCGRQRNARFYDRALASPSLEGRVSIPVTGEGRRHVYNQYVIRAQRRDELRAHLAAKGIGTEIYYPVPLHLQKCFAYLGYSAGDLPETERAAMETLALPIYPELDTAQLEYVVQSVAEFYS